MCVIYVFSVCSLALGGVLFSAEQRAVLLKYFNEYGMTSTHRRNGELMQKCAAEIGTTLERIKVGGVAIKDVQDEGWSFLPPIICRIGLGQRL